MTCINFEDSYLFKEKSCALAIFIHWKLYFKGYTDNERYFNELFDALYIDTSA